MYYYVVDSQHYDGKNFEFFQTQLLSLIGEYHVTGETARVTRLRSVEDLVATALSHGVTTLVVVGGDETFSAVAGAIRGKPITVGYIPVSSRSELRHILGIGGLADAVATIAKRRVEQLDLATINGKMFLSAVTFGAPPAESGGVRSGGWRAWLAPATARVTLRFDGGYAATDEIVAGSIINIRDNRGNSGPVLVGNPRDGRLDIVLASRLSFFERWRYRRALASGRWDSLPWRSVMHAKAIDILEPEGMPVYLSGQEIARAPAQVRIMEERIKVIVGRNRQF